MTCTRYGIGKCDAETRNSIGLDDRIPRVWLMSINTQGKGAPQS
jgi:hypothetical protein